MGAIKKIKENYNYFKLGVIESVKDRLKKRNIKEGNPGKNKRLDEHSLNSYHSTKGKNFWNKTTGGRMG